MAQREVIRFSDVCKKCKKVVLGLGTKSWWRHTEIIF